MTRIVSWFRTGSPTRAPFPTRWGGGFLPQFDEPDYRAVAEARCRFSKARACSSEPSPLRRLRTPGSD
jgi:hypothetical protein